MMSRLLQTHSGTLLITDLSRAVLSGVHGESTTSSDHNAKPLASITCNSSTLHSSVGLIRLSS